MLLLFQLNPEKWSGYFLVQQHQDLCALIANQQRLSFKAWAGSITTGLQGKSGLWRRLTWRFQVDHLQIAVHSWSVAKTYKTQARKVQSTTSTACVRCHTDPCEVWTLVSIMHAYMNASVACALFENSTKELIKIKQSSNCCLRKGVRRALQITWIRWRSQSRDKVYSTQPCLGTMPCMQLYLKMTILILVVVNVQRLCVIQCGSLTHHSKS